MANAEEIAREVLRAFFGDPKGFKNMSDAPCKQAVEAAEKVLKEQKME